MLQTEGRGLLSTVRRRLIIEKTTTCSTLDLMIMFQILLDVRFLMLMANGDVVVSYLDQLNNLRISEKDTQRALPGQFQDRCSNFM